jgi:branched-chain amino acid transport system permease protein
VTVRGAVPLGALSAACGVATAVLLPVLTTNQALLSWAFLVLLYTALAQSWNLLGGFGGQVNLGHAAFFGLGALATRMLWLGGAPVILALAAGTGVATAAGIVIGAPSLRLRGPYFAIGTLAIAEILRITTGNVLPDVSSLPARDLARYALAPRYYLAVFAAAIITSAAWWLARSRFGHGLAAVREDEAAAEAIGVGAFRHKLGAFALSSGFAGMTGGIFAYYHVSFYPAFVFSPVWTFDPLVIVYLGGVGTIWGPLAGAVFFVVVQEVLSLQIGEPHLLVFGLLFLVVVIAAPGGFVEALRALRRPGARRPAQAGSPPAA